MGPCFGLLVTSPLGFKARVGSLIQAVRRHTYNMFPEIHLWCDTCQPLGGQHGSQAISSTYLRGIGGNQNQELSCRRSQCEIRQTLYRLSYPGSAILALCFDYHKILKQTDQNNNCLTKYPSLFIYIIGE